MVEIMPLKPREVWAIPIGTEYMIHPAKQLVIPEEWVHVLPYHFPSEVTSNNLPVMPSQIRVLALGRRWAPLIKALKNSQPGRV